MYQPRGPERGDLAFFTISPYAGKNQPIKIGLVADRRIGEMSKMSLEDVLVLVAGSLYRWCSSHLLSTPTACVNNTSQIHEEIKST